MQTNKKKMDDKFSYIINSFANAERKHFQPTGQTSLRQNIPLTPNPKRTRSEGMVCPCEEGGASKSCCHQGY